MRHRDDMGGRPRRAGLVLAALTALAVTTALAQPGVAAAHGPNKQPVTVPALQKWAGAHGSFKFKPGSRILIDGWHPTLLAHGKRLADDLRLATGVKVPVVPGGRAHAGDISLVLDRHDGDDRDRDDRHGNDRDRDDRADGDAEQRYSLSITNRIEVSSRDAQGVFYGTQTVLQLIAQNRAVPRGTAQDWPAYRERSVMIDVARLFKTVDWLKNMIRQMSYLKYNTLHLHLSDMESFRLQSKRHPYITGALPGNPSQAYYTKAEITDLVAFATRYNVQVIPELEMPGHMLNQLDRYAAQPGHEDLRLRANDGTVQGSLLDVTKPAARALAKDLITEFSPWFTGLSGKYFHIGADEYGSDLDRFKVLTDYARQRYGPKANGADAVLDFVNYANSIVKSTGKISRAWSDGMHGGSMVKADSDIVAEHWENVGLTPEQLIAAGHQVNNSNYPVLYYSLGTRNFQDGRLIYETFAPNEFYGQTITARHPAQLGVQMLAWQNQGGGETEQDLARFLKDPLHALAAKAWGTSSVPTWEQFYQHIQKIGMPPGYTTALPPNRAQNRSVTATSATADHPVRLAVDGDASTYWQSAPGANQSITIDLGSDQPVSRVVTRFREVFPTEIDIQISTDGSTYQSIFFTRPRKPSQVASPIRADAHGRYVRLVMSVSSNAAEGYQLYEMEVINRK